MDITEFKRNIEKIKNNLGPINVKPREKFGGQFTFGYYLDESEDKYIVYEVTERQRFVIWNKLNNEEKALDELLDIIKFRSGIRD